MSNERGYERIEVDREAPEASRGRSENAKVRLANRFGLVRFVTQFIGFGFGLIDFISFKPNANETPTMLLPSSEEPGFSDPRKSNTSDALDKHARLKSTHLSPLVSRSNEL